MKIIRFIFLLTSLFYYNAAFTQDFWEPIMSYAHQPVSDIEVDSHGRIYLVLNDATEGGVISSDDNCATWQTHNSGLQFYVNQDLDLKDDSTIFLTGGYGIFKSVDRAQSWQWLYDAHTQSWEFSCIKAGFDSIVLVSGGRKYGILRSTDGGNTWKIVLNLYNEDHWEYVTDILFGCDNVIYACSRYTYNWSPETAKIYYSTDYGNTWQVFYEPSPQDGFLKLRYNNQGKLMACALWGIHMYDFNTQTWEFSPYNTIVSDLLVVPDNRVFMAGDDSGGGWGGVALSYDDGYTFPTVLNSGLPFGMAKEFAVEHTGRILMHNYFSLFRSYDTIFTGMHQKEMQANDILSCFPNPFRDIVTIKSNSDETSQLSIYGADGRQVLSKQLAPNEEYKFNASQMPPGLFLVSLKAKNQIQSIKIIHY